MVEFYKNIYEDISILTTGYDIKLGKLSKERKAIAIIVAPTSSNIHYADKSRIRNHLINFLVKSPNQLEAISAAEKIMDYYEFRESETIISTEIYTELHLAYSTDTNEYVYTLMINFETERSK